MTREAYGSAVGASLKRQRVSLGLTQDDVARGAGVTKSAISRWESGRRVMDAYSRESLKVFFREEWAKRKAALDQEAARAEVTA